MASFIPRRLFLSGCLLLLFSYVYLSSVDLGRPPSIPWDDEPSEPEARLAGSNSVVSPHPGVVGVGAPSSRRRRAVPGPDMSKVPEDTMGAYVFYNIYAGPTRKAKKFAAPAADVKGLVREQLYVMKESGLLDSVEKVYYLTIGKKGRTLSLQGSKMERIGALENGNETDTLSELWKFCRARPRANVIYMHTKGSYSPTQINIRLRRQLDCFVLNPQCLDALVRDDYDVCGYRASPWPHLHWPGNFWMAKCSYVRKLVDPLALETNETIRTALEALRNELGLPDWCKGPSLGLDRFFAETWIGSAPELKPADCLPDEVGRKYMYGYDIPIEAARPYCPNMNPEWRAGKVSSRGNFGAKCRNATMLVHPEWFRDLIKRREYKDCYKLEWTEGRTQLLYGQGATLMRRWRGLWGQKVEMSSA